MRLSEVSKPCMLHPGLLRHLVASAQPAQQQEHSANWLQEQHLDTALMASNSATTNPVCILEGSSNRSVKVNHACTLSKQTALARQW